MVKLIPEKDLGKCDWCGISPVVVFPLGTPDEPSYLCKPCIDKLIVETVSKKELTEEELRLGWQAIRQEEETRQRHDSGEEGQQQEGEKREEDNGRRRGEGNSSSSSNSE